MPFTLNLGFSGLNLFVQKATTHNQGLFVLMANMQMKNMNHYPVLWYDGAYAGSSGPQYLPLSGQVVNLRGLVTPGPKASLPKALANASTFAGSIPVDNKWLSGTPTDALAARVELDLGQMVVTDPASTAMMEVDYGGSAHYQPMAGVGTVVVSVTDPTITSITIGSLTLTPVDGMMNVTFANLPLNEYNPTFRPADGTPGEQSMHFSAFYTLLKGSPQGPIPMVPLVPPPIVGGEPVGLQGTDPIECLMADGCPECDPGCGQI